MNTVPRLTIPAKWRTRVYGAYGLLCLAAVLAQTAFSALNLPYPAWLTVALACLPIVGVAIGSTAATHVPLAPDAQQQERKPAAAAAGSSTTVAARADRDHTASSRGSVGFRRPRQTR